jgi:signal transduction histidine kinase
MTQSTPRGGEREGRVGRRAREKQGREDATRSSTERLHALYEVSKLLTRFESVEKTLPGVLSAVTRTVPLRRAILNLQRGKASSMTVWTPEGPSPDGLETARSRAEDTLQYLLGYAPLVPAGRSEIADNQGPQPGTEPMRQLFVGLPLVVDHERVFGVLQLEGVALDEIDLGFVNAVTNQLAIAVLRSLVEAEREELLEKEQHARAEAVAANRAKDQFLAVLSHELRTPLNAITGWAHLLKSGSLDGAQATTAIDTILRNAEIQKHLIGDILDARSIVAGELKLEVGALDLAGLIQTARDTLTPAAAAKQIAVALLLEAVPGLTPGDPSRLLQVVWNLLSNAIKFTPEHGNVRITLQDVDERHVEISVSDDGPGIPPEFLPHVFERFRQADSSTTRRYGGLGLGLAIVHSIVAHHGGTVSAKNAPFGHGAVFTVTLPRLTTTKAEGTPARSGTAWSPEGLPLEGVRVLVVDDLLDDREVLTRMLAAAGASVTAASSAAEGLQALERDRPHVLLTDVGMPGEDGYTLLRRVRALPQEKGGLTPAIVITAYTGSRERMFDGFQAQLAKPVHPDDLTKVVAGLARYPESLEAG